MKFRLWHLIIILLSPFFAFSQISILPVPPACEGETIMLSAIVDGVYGTESYTFEQFPYNPEPYVGGTPVIMTDDDVFPDDNIGLDIGFPFCFLNSSVDHFWIGSNGWISFLPGQSTAYVASALPNADAPQKAIFAPWQDWDPGTGPQHGEGYIFYKTEGVAPNRKLIVYWNNCPLYNNPCKDSTGKFQIVLHETTNIIDNHITLKSTCPSWPPGPGEANKATQGIQSTPDYPGGPIAYYIAFDRNQTSWHVWPGEEESTHFIPSGITWHEGTPTGPVVGNGDKIYVTATVSTTYWAVLAACDNSGNYEASVAVIVNPLPVPTILTGDNLACQDDQKIYTTQSGNNHYNWIATGGIIVDGGNAGDDWVKVQWVDPGVNTISINYNTPEGCTAVAPGSMNVTVTTFEAPVITTSANEFCPETQITFTTQTGKINYQWDYAASNPTFVSHGNTNENYVILAWNTPGTKTIYVNYTDPSGCTGDPPASKQITIKPLPLQDGSLVKDICSGSNTNINLVSIPAGADFSWTTPAPLCSGNIVACPAGSATGTQISDILSVNDFSPGTVRYYTTPVLDGCAGSVSEFLVNITPLPDVISTPANLAICSGQQADIHFTSSVIYTPVSFSWSVPVVPAGITIANTTGTGDIHEIITNSTNLPANLIINIFASANTCSTALPTTYTITVNPLPDVFANPASPQIICSGQQADVAFTSSVNYTPVNFAWTIPSVPPGINMVNTSGTGDIHEIITNSTNLPVDVVFSILSSTANCSAAAPMAYTVTVKPLPDVIAVPVSPLSICSDQQADVLFSSSVTYTTVGFNWTIPVVPPGITIANSAGTGDFHETISNSTYQPIDLVISIMPTAANCSPGAPTLYTVTVNPLPNVSATPVSPLTICSGQQADVAFASLVTYTPVAFNWSVPVVPSGITMINTSGIADIHEVISNTTALPVDVVFSITPSTNTCSSLSPMLYTVRVNPIPDVIASPSSPQAICSGQQADVLFSSSVTSSPVTFNWSVPILPAGITILHTSGTGDIHEVIGNSTVNQVNVDFIVMPSANGCSPATPSLYSVMVNPLPDVTFAPGSPSSICSGQQANIGFLSSVTYTPVTFSWSIPSLPAGITISNSTGSGDIHEVISNSTISPINLIFSILPTANFCSPASPTLYSLTINPMPDVIANPASPLSICSGNPAMINFSSSVTYTPVTYTWSLPIVPPGVTIANTTGISGINEVITNSNTTPVNLVFSIIPTANGCSPTLPTSYTTEVKPLPVIDITGPAIACVNTPGPHYFTEAGQFGYTWTVNGGTYTPGITPDMIDVVWTSTGTQNVTVNYTNIYGCTAVTPASFSVVVSTLPVPTITSGPGTICTGVQTSYKTQQGMDLYTWTVSPDGIYTGDNTDQIDVTWSIPGLKQITVNYQMGPGCTGASPATKSVLVKQSTTPAITSPVNPICQNSATTYSTQGGMTGYIWTVSPGGHFTTPVDGSTVGIKWDNPGPQYVEVIFTNADGCTSTTPFHYSVQVNPLPNTLIAAPPAPYCQDYPTTYAYSVPTDPGSLFAWTILPPSGYTITPGAVSSDIQVHWTSSGTYTISVTGTNTTTGCSATSVPAVSAVVFAKPAVSLTACFDIVTTRNAKPFILKGGIPLGSGGKYYIDGTLVPGNILDPGALGPASHVVSFTYTDNNGCLATDNKTITVEPSNANYICGNNTFTDPRNPDPATNKYPTIPITANGRTTCWMLKNFNWGTTESSTLPQTDNCIPQRYCAPGDNNCTAYGSLYQWDELMQYGSTPGWPKGICPPGWHVPGILDWQDLIDVSANMAPGDGLAGNFLTYASGFNALFNGINYQNNSWAFTSGNPVATMFWTSTISANKPIARGINSISPSVSIYESSKADAYPVRCVKD
ncbi:MAG: PKD-like domain-containing protein [Bacteroidales bacterium]